MTQHNTAFDTLTVFGPAYSDGGNGGGAGTTITNKPSTNKPLTGGGDKKPGGEKCVLRDGLNPHPSDCNKFYNCAHGIPHIMSCPSGLNFNPNLKICDWPRNYGCP